MTSDSFDRDLEESADLLQSRLWLRIISLRQRLWSAFALFLVIPFLIAIATGSAAAAMLAAAAIVLVAVWTMREIAKSKCPSCEETYFTHKRSGRRVYNNFTSKCMSCGWSAVESKPK